MLKIYKYPLPVDDEWHDLPVNGKITFIGPDPVRNDVVNIWAVHYDTPPDHEGPHTRRFRAFGTGQPLPPNTRPENILGSVITRDGQYVWHVADTWYPGNE
jgi:hypothetical protein